MSNDNALQKIKVNSRTNSEVQSDSDSEYESSENSNKVITTISPIKIPNKNNNNDNQTPIKKPSNSGKRPKDDRPKDDRPRDDRPWNYGIQLMLKKIGEKSAGYKWMHKQDQNYYESADSWFGRGEILILAILAFLTSGEFIALLTSSGFSSNSAAMISITALQLFFIALYSVIKGFRENGNYPDAIWQNKYYSARFDEINLDIQEQLSLRIADRATDKDFLKSIIKTYNHLMEVSPSIRDQTADKYIDGTKDVDIYKPLIVGEFDKIEIVIQDDNTGNTTKINVNDNNNSYNFDDRDKNQNRYELERYLKNM